MKHITLGLQRVTEQRDALCGVLILMRSEIMIQASNDVWEDLICSVYDIGDLASRRRDLCRKSGAEVFANHWAQLADECAEVIISFSSCLIFLLPDISKTRSVVWN